MNTHYFRLTQRSVLLSLSLMSGFALTGCGGGGSSPVDTQPSTALNNFSSNFGDNTRYADTVGKLSSDGTVQDTTFQPDNLNSYTLTDPNSSQYNANSTSWTNIIQDTSPQTTDNTLDQQSLVTSGQGSSDFGNVTFSPGVDVGGRATRKRAASLSASLPLPKDNQLNLYYYSQLCKDGSTRVDYYLDPNAKQTAGYLAIEAPRVSSQTGSYPVVIRMVEHLNNYHAQGDVDGVLIYKIDDSSASSGSFVNFFVRNNITTFEYTTVDSNGVTVDKIVRDTSSSAAKGPNTLVDHSESPTNSAYSIEMFSAYVNTDANYQTTNDANGQPIIYAASTLLEATDGSGQINLVDSANNTVGQITWDQSGQGQAQYASNPSIIHFNNIDNYLLNGDTRSVAILSGSRSRAGLRKGRILPTRALHGRKNILGRLLH